MNNIRRITFLDAAYPSLLREIPGPPESLYASGPLPEDGTPSVAIVGTRKATRDGIRTARSLARTLSEHGICVVSGLALGIDAAAHEGALEGRTPTIAVLANGLDAIYPATNEQLARRILDAGGCLLSEYPEGSPALPHQFLERNRIVSGLSRGVVVVEAPHRSGSLATARHAAEQGREVFVIPGPVTHPNFVGSHELIRNGARLVTSAENILEDLGLIAPAGDQTPGIALPDTALSGTGMVIVKLLKRSQRPLTLDEIVGDAKLPPETVSRELTLLMLDGAVEEKGGTFIIKHTRG